jgi:hypothetical protein
MRKCYSVTTPENSIYLVNTIPRGIFLSSWWASSMLTVPAQDAGVLADMLYRAEPLFVGSCELMLRYCSWKTFQFQQPES